MFAGTCHIIIRCNADDENLLKAARFLPFSRCKIIKLCSSLQIKSKKQHCSLVRFKLNADLCRQL